MWFTTLYSAVCMWVWDVCDRHRQNHASAILHNYWITINHIHVCSTMRGRMKGTAGSINAVF